MGSLLTACARPKSENLDESTDPTGSRVEVKYVDGDMPVPPGEPVIETRIGRCATPEPYAYRANGKKVKVDVDVETDVESTYSVDSEGY